MSMSELKKTMHPDQRVEMMRFEFQWQPSQTDSSVLESEIYSITVTTLENEPITKNVTDFYGMVKCKLERKGFPSNNFSSAASYYYSFVGQNIKSNNLKKKFEVSLAKGTIWTRFYELTRISLNQSGIYNVHIPLIPIEITYNSQSL
jgi:hypothetical protein